MINNLSILSGKYKGTKLLSPGGGTHPMGSREKLALFNMLAPYLEGANVLDCFAGSGALGLEALSRGASRVTFVENNSRALQIIRQNLRAFSPENATVLSHIPDEFEDFSIIISDPPYDNYQVLDYASLLAPGGILALSHPSNFDLGNISDLTLLKTSHYARCNISLFTK